ncbi:hypothetical protein [Metabacillus indicus]|nr:hypothetical protein [Metabacillus indicus]
MVPSNLILPRLRVLIGRIGAIKMDSSPLEGSYQTDWCHQT